MPHKRWHAMTDRNLTSPPDAISKGLLVVADIGVGSQLSLRDETLRHSELEPAVRK